MIQFEKWQLDNGLTVILNEDKNTPLVTVNLMYNVGAKDENPEMTGLAHLFEHLMFSGSKNADNFDEILQKAGGENNAFTSNDITNYYITIPKENIETALWLESDRMQDLNLDQNSLDVQKKVVIEEFKQRYFNQPYGDVWLSLRPLCFRDHPYQWPTIGKSIEQIEQVTLKDALDFYQRFYAPNNGTLSISGNISQQETKSLVEKYFSNKTSSNINRRAIKKEGVQLGKRFAKIEADVPFDALYMAFHSDKKESRGFHTADLLTDILSGGSSSRFYLSLVKEQEIFSDINAYLTGESDPGLLVISGNLTKGISLEKGEEAVWKELNKLQTEGLQEKELQKVINKKLTAEVYTEMKSLNKAIKLAFFNTIDELSEVNNTMTTLQSITEQEVVEYAKSYLVESKCSLLHYISKQD